MQLDDERRPHCRPRVIIVSHSAARTQGPRERIGPSLRYWRHFSLLSSFLAGSHHARTSRAALGACRSLSERELDLERELLFRIELPHRDPIFIPTVRLSMPAHGRHCIPHVIRARRPRVLRRLPVVDVNDDAGYVLRQPRAERRVMPKARDTEAGAVHVDVYREFAAPLRPVVGGEIHIHA